MADLIYKYMDSAGFRKLLFNCTLKFTRPQELNDPFDVYIDDLFGMDVMETLNDISIAIFDLLTTDPDLAAAKLGLPLEEVKRVYHFINSRKASETKAARGVIGSIGQSEFGERFDEVRKNLQKSRDEFASQFSSYGIFCATSDFHNLLMWAHYADKHRGVVVGFEPDLARDSFLRLMRPVEYKTERPYIFKDGSELVHSTSTMELTADINNRLLYTKGVEWSYEKELRLAIPNEIQQGQPASFLKFYPNELVELYLGCRMSEDAKRELAAATKLFNPNVRIFGTTIAKRNYALSFQELKR